MADRYQRIATSNYRFDDGPLTNSALMSFFDRCFDEALNISGLYPAYGCIVCATNSSGKIYLGEKPRVCRDCGSKRVFELATFQGRAPVYGATFVGAVQVLFQRRFDLALTPTPHNTRTHDLEASPQIAIEAKGSARRVRLSGSDSVNLKRAGLRRSDTEKKAEANARTYKRFNPSGTFYVVTNALPDRLRGIRTDDIDGYFDLTKAARVEAFAREIREKMSFHLPLT